MDFFKRYNKVLNQIPPPGGNGCHASLLGVANLGVSAGLDGEQIFSDILQNIPQGKRRVSDREILDAVNKALSDHNGGRFTPTPRPQPIVANGKTALQRIIEQGKISDEADLWEHSPIRLYDEPEKDPVLFLETLFPIDALIWIGTKYQEGVMGATIRTTGEWIQYFRNGGATAPHIITNPLSGKPALTESGDKETYRGNNNVKAYHYSPVEFDNLPRESQIRFWSAIKLPIVALIDTAGKSLHAWVDVSMLAKVDTPENWQTHIKMRLYDRLLRPLEVDAACSNPARLSRLPGHFREEKGKYQRLLWLSPEGRTINGSAL
ncbi:MAG: hypothetical protein C0392_15400 [Syntrophus sp. (in: bacteria)]|nr:hypothetical protein [Syntrophus sp. (in: bacteria)]